MSAREELREYLKVRGLNDLTTAPTIIWLCEQIDRLRDENSKLRVQVDQREVTILDMVKFWQEWDSRGDNFPSKLQLMAARTVSFDKTVAELTHRLAEWDRLKERVNKCVSDMETIFKGGTL